MFALRELWSSLVDAWCHGDLRGHLSAWWQVARGKVKPEDRVWVAGDRQVKDL
jgi:hypothetical protein